MRKWKEMIGRKWDLFLYLPISHPHLFIILLHLLIPSLSLLAQTSEDAVYINTQGNYGASEVIFDMEGKDFVPVGK